MVFSSISFLYVFLPTVLIVYFITPRKYKNIALLVSSLAFYYVGEQKYVIILLFSSISDYFHAIFIEKYFGTKKAKIALVSSIIINLALLGFFKYADFLISTLNSLGNLHIPLLHIPLPIGISFFTFQTMSYTIDVYRGDVKAERKFSDLFTFVALFPQLIAGPIVRYKDISEKLHHRVFSYNDMYFGIREIGLGLFKKIIIANNMGKLCSIFETSSDKSILFFWVYALAFTFQIYFDFAGYSDMAIGLGKIFGFDFPTNFDFPLTSKSITEFWRRWHMTLGQWFRDYLYIPLGGNRCSLIKNLRNIFIVWLLTGLWHGASWNFVLWGLFFAVILILEKLYLLKILDKMPNVLNHIYVLFLVLFSFVIFKSESMDIFLYNVKGLFGLLDVGGISTETIYYLKSYSLLFVIASVFSTKFIDRIPNTKAYKLLEPILIGAVLVITTSSLVEGGFNPFLYFRF